MSQWWINGVDGAQGFIKEFLRSVQRLGREVRVSVAYTGSWGEVEMVHRDF